MGIRVRCRDQVEETTQPRQAKQIAVRGRATAESRGEAVLFGFWAASTTQEWVEQVLLGVNESMKLSVALQPRVGQVHP